MTPLQAVAWDIDGTLIDSEPVHHIALLTVSARYGVDLSSEPEHRFVGRHLGDVWLALAKHYPRSLEQAAWLAEIHDVYIDNLPRLNARPKMVEAVRALHKRGIPQACVSNSERRIVDANLEVLGIANYIAFSISREDVAVGKPDPAPYREACRRLKFAPDEVLAVEDSGAGVQAAVSAGMPVILAPSGNDADLQQVSREILERLLR